MQRDQSLKIVRKLCAVLRLATTIGIARKIMGVRLDVYAAHQRAVNVILRLF